MIDLRKGFERRSVVLLNAVLAGSSTNAVHPHAPVFHPRLPARDRFTPSDETVTRERGNAAARAPARVAICCVCAHGRRVRPLDYRSIGSKFVGANTRARAGDGLSGGREPALLRGTAPASSASSA